MLNIIPLPLQLWNHIPFISLDGSHYPTQEEILFHGRGIEHCRFCLDGSHYLRWQTLPWHSTSGRGKAMMVWTRTDSAVGTGWSLAMHVPRRGEGDGMASCCQPLGELKEHDCQTPKN